MANHADAQGILDTALDLAEAQSWEAVRLHDIATVMDISLDDIRRHYPHKDALVEAWFDRADQAMLEQAGRPEFLRLTGRERLQQAIMNWVNALNGHRRTTRSMLRYNLRPGHVQLQTHGLMRINRTVQWLLETTQHHPPRLQRIAEEAVTTSIFLSTLAHWLRDDSPNSERTYAHLDRRLQRAERVSQVLSGLGGVRRSKPPTTVSL